MRDNNNNWPYGKLRRYLREHVTVVGGHLVHNFAVDPRDERPVSACAVVDGQPMHLFFGYYDDVVADIEKGLHERSR